MLGTLHLTLSQLLCQTADTAGLFQQDPLSKRVLTLFIYGGAVDDLAELLEEIPRWVGEKCVGLEKGGTEELFSTLRQFHHLFCLLQSHPNPHLCKIIREQMGILHRFLILKAKGDPSLFELCIESLEGIAAFGFFEGHGEEYLKLVHSSIEMLVPHQPDPAQALSRLHPFLQKGPASDVNTT